MKRVFGLVEIIFDLVYLFAAFIMGIILLTKELSFYPQLLVGIMVFVLVGGDAFHLIPRIKVILSKDEEKYRIKLGRGKQITSITMSLFYLLLWFVGLLLFSLENVIFYSGIIIGLTVIRIVVCLLPQNQWIKRYPPLSWALIRNSFFLLEGLMVAILFYINRESIEALRWMWLAILLSYLFYIPVVLWSNKNAKIGMLMLPKSIAYLWIIVMFLFL